MIRSLPSQHMCGELEKRAAKLEAKLSLAGKLLDLQKSRFHSGIDLASGDES